MFNAEVVIQEGINLPATASSALIWNGKQNIENHVEIVAKRIKVYMKGKKKVAVSELVENLEESADIILRALKLLREKGHIQET